MEALRKAAGSVCPVLWHPMGWPGRRCAMSGCHNRKFMCGAQSRQYHSTIALYGRPEIPEVPDILYLHSPTEPRSYLIEKALYHIDADRLLWLSIECGPSRESPEGTCFCFCLLRYPLEDELAAGTVLWLPYAYQQNPYVSDECEHASSHAYDCCVHYNPWGLRLDVRAAQPGLLRMAGTFLLEGEVTAAGFRARKEHVSFDAEFRSAALEEIWNPGY